MGTGPAILEIVGVMPAKKSKKIFIFPLVAVFLIILVVSFFCYKNHYAKLALPNTFISQLEVSGMNEAQIKKLLSDQEAKIRIQVDGVATKQLTLPEIGIKIDLENSAKKALANSSELSKVALSLIKKQQVPIVFNQNEQLATVAARSLGLPAQGAVIDPGIEANEVSKSFVARVAKAGLGISPQSLGEAGIRAVKKLETTKFHAEFTQVLPVKIQPELESWIKQANALITPEVNIGTPRGKIHQLGAHEKLNWVALPESNDKNILSRPPDIDPRLVEASLQAYVQEHVNYTPPPGQRRLTKDGKLLKVISAGRRGLQVSNVADLAVEITKALREGKAVNAKFITQRTEAKYEDIITNEKLKISYQPSPNQRWISVDIANNTVSAYLGTTLKYGPVAAVTGARPAPTPAGVYRVWLKRSSQIMKGTGWDGDYESFTPWVLFFHGDYALHGAPWRSAFVYGPYTGSHGCVNLSVEDAKWFYDFASVGTVVVTHR